MSMPCKLEWARETRGVLGRARGYALAFSGLIFLGGTVLIFNFFQMLTLLIWPFSSAIFRASNRSIAGRWWVWCVFWTERVLKVQIDVTGDDLPLFENALIIANHQEMPDILILMSLASRKKRLKDMKWFVKDVLKYIPGIGWGMLFLDCVFLKRDWAQDRKRIERTFALYRKREISFWLVSFVEATRITAKKLARSQEFSMRRGLPVFKRVLVPRSRGFISSMQGLGGRCPAVYDVTLAFEGGIPSLWQFMTGVTRRAAIHVCRFDRLALPSGDGELARWLNQRFIEKDARLERFALTGRLD